MILDIEPISLGISLLLIAAFIAPLYVYTKRVKEKNRFLIQNQLAQAKNLGFELLEYEMWRGRYFLGIDQSRQYLLFNPEMGTSELEVIALSKINSTGVSQEVRTLISGKEKVIIIDKIGIELKGSDKSTYVEVFDRTYYSDLNGEKVIAQKWLGIIKNAISSQLQRN
ncbi:hypothetical protein [Arthrospiribacter ruber]|uniref:Uncharacterized protein n=1 Tax=Arthrospiribacter ruber TaxID=2487934 RepID=A0A951MCM9_9BACT|nr:hypothetical protein [Arthrospiribacter ruber]MBW3468084.1 hypothetical protein [Arthrospiribacter ruber]